MTSIRLSSLSRLSTGLVACLALLASPAFSQSAEEGAFVLLVGADTFGIENFTRRADGLTGEMTSRAIGKIAYTASLGADGNVPRLTLQYWGAGAPHDGPPTQGGTLTADGDSVTIDITDPPGVGSQQIASQDSAFIYLSPSFLLTEQMIMRARAMGGSAAVFPVFMAQGGETATVRVTFIDATTANVSILGSEIRATIDARGSLQSAAIPAQGLTVSRVDGRNLPPIALEAPDYSAPEGAPYSAEEVVVPTPAGHSLTGTLTLPRGGAPSPAAILITGSGAQDRDEAIPILRGYRAFREIADSHGRPGVAVLRLA